MRDAVAAIFADRANLAATLVDARGVVRALRSLLGGVVHAACCFLYLAIWDVSCSVFVFLSFFLGVFCSLEVKKRERARFCCLRGFQRAKINSSGVAMEWFEHSQP